MYSVFLLITDGNNPFSHHDYYNIFFTFVAITAATFYLNLVYFNVVYIFIDMILDTVFILKIVELRECILWERFHNYLMIVMRIQMLALKHLLSFVNVVNWQKSVSATHGKKKNLNLTKKFAISALLKFTKIFTLH